MSDKTNDANLENILRIKRVTARTGLGVSSVYAQIAKGSFPKPIRLSERAVGWLESDIEAWIADRIKARAEA